MAVLPFAQQGFPGFEITSWFGIWIPKGASEQTIQSLQSDLEAVYKKPEFVQKLTQAGITPSYRSGPALATALHGSTSERRAIWEGNLVVKGLLFPEDARICAEIGVDGIVVSNHGGRQVDGAVSSLEMLPSIVRAAPGTVIMMDSGIRRGSDVLKALALGAQCVFAGRPFNFALAYAGQAGVEHALKLLHDEVHPNTALLGLRHPAEADSQLLMRA